MTDSVPSWQGPTGGQTQKQGTAGWSGRPRGANTGPDVEQLAQQLFDELGKTRAALEQVHLEAQAARADARTAREEAHDAHEAAEILLEQVTAWESGEPVSGLPRTDRRERRGEREDGGAGASEPPGTELVVANAAGPTPRDGEVADPLAEALAEFADELRDAADARTRGEIDARQALRLARSGFHKAHRAISRVGREELRSGG